MNIWTKIFGHKKYQQFVVICNPRTGSNLLSSYLKSHPNIKMHGEIFRFLRGQTIRDLYSVFYKKKPRKIKTSGFKLLYTHPEDGDPEKILELLDSIPDLSVIHLTRKDKMATLVSWKIAVSTGVWGLKEQQPLVPISAKKISVEPLEALLFLDQIQKNEGRIHARFKCKKYLHIIYEDLVDKTDETLKQVMEFLDVPSHNLQTAYQKSNPEPLSELISNYRELVDAGILDQFDAKQGNVLQ